jgi:hypothetical protein
MRETESISMRRREFLASTSLLLLSAGSLKASPFSPQGAIRGPEVREDLNPAEAESVKNSIMARDMENFWGKGYSCAETGLAVALRYMHKPEDLVWVAGGFGGGMMHQDLCGFLTAGIMAIGLHVGSLDIEKTEAKKRCSQLVNEYWNWWASVNPLRCSEIRKGRSDYKVCNRLGQLAAVKLENLLKV